jgi:hypothetical protein
MEEQIDSARIRFCDMAVQYNVVWSLQHRDGIKLGEDLWRQ